jgi:hypothetical protein
VARLYIRLFDTLPIYQDVEYKPEIFNILLRRKKFLAQCLRQDLEHGVILLDYYAHVRSQTFGTNPSRLGIS